RGLTGPARADAARGGWNTPPERHALIQAALAGVDGTEMDLISPPPFDIIA
ncbi:MAG: hypothetical protein JWP17_1342, partial [Solirubrobacterales bacterium]|nr:hypothetical protein [Solirubrobacterales bacterium]